MFLLSYHFFSLQRFLTLQLNFIIYDLLVLLNHSIEKDVIIVSSFGLLQVLFHIERLIIVANNTWEIILSCTRYSAIIRLEKALIGRGLFWSCLVSWVFICIITEFLARGWEINCNIFVRKTAPLGQAHGHYCSEVLGAPVFRVITIVVGTKVISIGHYGRT